MKRGNVRKFGRKSNIRKALIRSLMTALIDNSRIKTTQAKAKALSKNIDRLVTLAKKETLASRRLIGETVGDKATKKLIGEISPKLKDKKGGYTRIIRLSRRQSDGAPMALVEFTYTEPTPSNP